MRPFDRRGASELLDRCGFEFFVIVLAFPHADRSISSRGEIKNNANVNEWLVSEISNETV